MASKRKPQINWADDAAKGLRKVIESALMKSGVGNKKKAEQALRVSRKIAKSSGQPAGVRATAKELQGKAAKSVKQISVTEAGLRRSAAQRERADVLVKGTKRVNKMELEAAKGRGVYQSTTGKTKVVGKDRAKEGRQRSGAIASQMKKEAAQEAKLQAAVKNARTNAERIQARRALTAFRKKTGR